MSRELTVAECEKLQKRCKDAFGNRYPYKGRWHDSASPYRMPDETLPKGWVFVHIPTWGLHVRREDDTDYKKDLESWGLHARREDDTDGKKDSES